MISISKLLKREFEGHVVFQGSEPIRANDKTTDRKINGQWIRMRTYAKNGEDTKPAIMWHPITETQKSQLHK